MTRASVKLTETPPPSSAARAGADLRTAREHLGLDLQDVAAMLRIREPYLRALEEGQVASLPGQAYALAFVRSYASAMGLNAQEMVRRFRTGVADSGRGTQLDFPAPMPERGLPGGAVLLLGLVLAIAAYIGWYRLSADGQLPPETVMPIPQRLAPLAEQAIPPIAGSLMTRSPSSASPVSASPGPSSPRSGSSPFNPGAPSPGMPDLAAVEPMDNRPAADPPVLPLVDPAPAAMLTDPAPPPGAVPPVAAAARLSPPPADASAVAGTPAPPASAAPPAADAGRIVLHATADAWVMVRARDGAVLLSRTLKAGETWPVPPRPDLLLTTGNAGGTDLLVDGASTASLGGSGVVRRDLPLDPDLIRNGGLAGVTTPQLASTRPHQ